MNEEYGVPCAVRADDSRDGGGVVPEVDRGGGGPITVVDESGRHVEMNPDQLRAMAAMARFAIVDRFASR